MKKKSMDLYKTFNFLNDIVSLDFQIGIRDAYEALIKYQKYFKTFVDLVGNSNSDKLIKYGLKEIEDDLFILNELKKDKYGKLIDDLRRSLDKE